VIVAKQPESLSVIIPLAPQEEKWKDLTHDLSHLPSHIEIIFISTSEPSHLDQQILENSLSHHNWFWIVSSQGRAHQLNVGAEIATQKFLWFLHADSRFDLHAFSKLLLSLQANPSALHYFDLTFQNDGPPFTRINAVGVWLRSHWLGLPFGDQAFCIQKDYFLELKGFDESLSLGEDHNFIWKAKRKKISICCTRGSISTSARKYREHGWIQTTMKHLFLTAQQAFPCRSKSGILNRRGYKTPPRL